jgi:hypothetical protein
MEIWIQQVDNGFIVRVATKEEGVVSNVVFPNKEKVIEFLKGL